MTEMWPDIPYEPWRETCSALPWQTISLPFSGRPGGQMGGVGGGQTADLPEGLGGRLGGLFGGAGAAATDASETGGGLGGLLGGGLGELDQQFRRNGRGDVVDSWVGTGQNREVEPQDPEAALGPDVLEDLIEAKGLSREELLLRLSRELPKAVGQYTPQGRIPQPHEFG